MLTSAVGARPGTSMHADGFRIVRVAAWNLTEDRFGAPFPLCAPSLWVHAMRLVRSADVVHVHEVLYLPSWATALGCALQRKPYLLTQHVQVVAHVARSCARRRCSYTAPWDARSSAAPRASPCSTTAWSTS